MKRFFLSETEITVNKSLFRYLAFEISPRVECVSRSGFHRVDSLQLVYPFASCWAFACFLPLLTVWRKAATTIRASVLVWMGALSWVLASGVFWLCGYVYLTL